jgi:Ca2+-binding RTX toxin-like protein
MATIYGTNGNDQRWYEPFNWKQGLAGTGEADFIYGFGGDDDLFGQGGNDWLDGGTGADRMEGDAGNDTYVVDNAGDRVIETDSFGNPGFDTVRSYISYTLPENVERLELLGLAISGNGNALGNEIVGNTQNNTLDGRDGDDIIWGMGGRDTIYGSEGDDDLVGGEGNDELYGEEDEDQLWGENGNDTLYGGSHDDMLWGGDGDDALYGEGGADVLFGGRDNDAYYVVDALDQVVEAFGEGHDTVHAYNVNFTLSNNVEDLFIESGQRNGTGNSLNNKITGSLANNTLNGMDGNDTLFGMNGADTLRGGNHSDELHGGLGNDTLFGDAGADHFVFDTALGSGNIDTIADFNVADDTIWLDNSVFTALPAADLAMLSSSQFRVGWAAMDSSDRIIYNPQNGALLYDADGMATKSAAVQFATLTTGLSMTADDFIIV